jgi:WD40 repeat protein/serine/threonine protein kinase
MQHNCPSEQQLLAFHLGKLVESEVDAVAEHLESCRHCESVLERLDSTSDLLLAALRTPVPGDEMPIRPELPQTGDVDPLDPFAPENWPVLLGYEVLAPIGRGGMGVVYKARQQSLNRMVALKQLRVGSERSIARSRAEAEALARLQHPNIVQIHEILVQDGKAYLALELVEGGSLDDKLTGKPQPPRETAELVVTLAHAVHYAHLHGIVHRDLKPANILLAMQRAEGRGQKGKPDLDSCLLPFAHCLPKIADFSIAKQLASETGATQEGDVLGTPCYMAPEQASGRVENIGPATDVYSLGVILYQMLTGRVPLQGPTTLDTLLLVRGEDPLPPRRLQPRIPRDLETVCLKCLEKQLANRYASAADLVDDLQRFLGGKPVRARPTPAWERTWKWAKRRPAVAALSAAVVLVASLALVLVTWQWQRAEDKAVQARQAEGDARSGQKRAQEAEARLALQQGQALCEQGDVGRGLLWLARGLERADGADAAELDRPLRANLAVWGRQLRTSGAPIHNPAAVLAMAFDPTGRLLLAGGKDGQVHCWDVEDGREVGAPLKPPTSLPKIWVGCLEFSPDGRTIATASNGAAVLWDAATHERIGAPLPHPPGMIWGMTFLPDGRHLATSSDDGTVRIWDLSTRRVSLGPLKHPGTEKYCTLALEPSGQLLLTTGQDGGGILWNLDSGKPTPTSLAHSSEVLKAVFSRDSGRLFTATRGGTLHAWDLLKGRVTDLPPQGAEATALAASLGGQLLASGTGFGIVRLWNAATLRTAGPVYVFRARISALAFSPDGHRLAIGMEDGEIRVIEAPAAHQAVPVAKLSDEVHAVQYNPDGSRLLVATPDCVAWLEAASGRILRYDEHLTNPRDLKMECAALSPDGKSFVVGRWSGVLSAWRGRVELWDSATGQRRWQSPDQPSPIGGIAFHPDSQSFVSWSRYDYEGEAALWDVASGRRLRPLLKALGEVRVRQAVFHPDGRELLLACDDGRARLWDVTADTEIDRGRPMDHAGVVTACAFAAEGRQLLTGCRDGSARLWDATTCQPLLEPLRHEAEVSSVAFSPDGRTLLTGSLDGAARFWDSRSGRPLGPTLWHADGVRTVAFHPDGRRAATGGKDFSVRQWYVSASSLGGSPEHIRLWVEALSGLELDELGAVHELSTEAQEQRRRRIEELGAISVPSG